MGIPISSKLLPNEEVVNNGQKIFSIEFKHETPVWYWIMAIVSQGGQGPICPHMPLIANRVGNKLPILHN